jgi:glycerate 2-kinase
MSDGGDGFGEILSELLQAEPRTLQTLDAAHRPCESRWWWQAASCTAIVESAQVIGLARLPAGQFHPFQLDTFGLGTVLRAAAQTGARRCLIGIGGSATNDGGFGLARALGWRFMDANHNEITGWTGLAGLQTMSPPPDPLPFDEMLVAVDVQNVLLGPSGCSRVYGPQKGLRPADFPAAESCLARLAETVSRDLCPDLHLEPGTGAAGGLGFGLRAFGGARLEPGFDLYANMARLRERLEGIQLVITGEGAIDESSLMGKGVGEVARLCDELKLPCIGLGGRVSDAVRSSPRFHRLAAIAPELTTPADAQQRAAFWLEQLAGQAARQWPSARP